MDGARSGDLTGARTRCHITESLTPAIIEAERQWLNDVDAGQCLREGEHD